jgi:integrase
LLSAESTIGSAVMPKEQSKLFSVIEAPKPNGKCTHYITGYPKGVRERYWYHSEKEAKQAAKDRNDELLAFGTNTALAADVRLMANECMKMLEPFGKNLYDATHFLVNHLRALETSVSVRAMTAAIRKEFERRVASGEIGKGHRKLMRHFLGALDSAFGDTLVKKITAVDLRSWVAATESATKTRNNMLGYWQNAWAIAKDLGLVTENPVADVKRFTASKVAKVDNPKCLSIEQLTALLYAASGEIIPYVALGAFAGIRSSERRQLDWSMFDLKKTRITIPAHISKNGEERRIPIYDNLLEWLRPHAKASGSILPVLPDGTPRASRLENLLTEAQKAAGLYPWSPRYKNGLRKSFCSYHYEWTGSADRTAEYAGHDIKMLIRIYRYAVEHDDSVKYFEIKPK